ncbi:hypothetical protein [Pseudomonas serbica]|uniref:hypothetical protein n=1 Tax=Pseudomonas serbica TaxID=2965074 RepID=UPI00237A435F|nr:hypothetical protein [Pseudomonas serbica]
MDTPDNSALRPKKLDKLYAVVAASGIDVSEWHTGKGHYETNPSFCFRWAFVGEKTALLCLWADSIKCVGGVWTYEGNARADQLERAAAGADHWDKVVRNRARQRATIAHQIDEVLKQAYRNKLGVRICIVDARAKVSESEITRADYRELDPVSWQLTYDMMTGAYSVRRDVETQHFESAVA